MAPAVWLRGGSLSGTWFVHHVSDDHVAYLSATLNGVTSVPVIGPSATEEGAFHAFGFSAHGFQLGPGVGSVMAELIVDGRTNAPLAPFSITRFRQGAEAAAGEPAKH